MIWGSGVRVLLICGKVSILVCIGECVIGSIRVSVHECIYVVSHLGDYEILKCNPAMELQGCRSWVVTLGLVFRIWALGFGAGVLFRDLQGCKELVF